MSDGEPSADTPTGVTRLTNLEVKEVSVVDLGANERPFALMKNLEGAEMPPSKAVKEKAEAKEKAAVTKEKAEGVVEAKTEAEADTKVEAVSEGVAKADADRFPPGDGVRADDTVTVDKSIAAAIPLIRDAVAKSNPELAGHLDAIVAQLSKGDAPDAESDKALEADVEKAKRMTGGRMGQLTKLASGLSSLASELASFAKQFGGKEESDDAKKGAEPDAEARGDSVQTSILKAMLETNEIMAKRLEILETTQPAARGQGPSGVAVQKSAAQKEEDLWSGIGGTRRL